jgi:hypothetical protein
LAKSSGFFTLGAPFAVVSLPDPVALVPGEGEVPFPPVDPAQPAAASAVAANMARRVGSRTG